MIDRQDYWNPFLETLPSEKLAKIELKDKKSMRVIWHNRSRETPAFAGMTTLETFYVPRHFCITIQIQTSSARNALRAPNRSIEAGTFYQPDGVWSSNKVPRFHRLHLPKALHRMQ
jgi:hypothetical protein